MPIRPIFQVLLLIVVSLAVYYPALLSSFSSVDDLKMITQLDNQQVFNLSGYFRPNSSFYYRPLLMLTFIGDKYLWGLTPSVMHLENVVLHALNAVMVFIISRRIFPQGKDWAWFPFLSALLFSIHPINTESVNWISGRTDLLATFFVLLSCRVLIWSVESRRPALGLLAALFFLAGMMSKEMSLFFLPVGCCLVWRWQTTTSTDGDVFRLKCLLFFSGPFIISAFIYGFSRFLLYGSGDAGFNYIFSQYLYDPINTFRVIFKVFGFYVKKLFIPTPLQFAITNASDYYFWLGLLTATVSIYLVQKIKMLTDFMAISFFLIIPAIIIALTNVAWTPLAERYLYLPTVFWSISVAGILSLFLRMMNQPLLNVLLLFVVFPGITWITFERNLVWKDPVLFFENEVKNNPNFPPLRNELANALRANGSEVSANEQMAIALDLDPNKKMYYVHFNNILLLIKKNHIDEARNQLNDLVEKRGNDSVFFLRQVARTLEAMVTHSRSNDELQIFLQDLMPIYEKILEKKEDPYVFYRAGQIALLVDERIKARDYFGEAYRLAPDTAYYKAAAQTLHQKLSVNENHLFH